MRIANEAGSLSRGTVTCNAWSLSIAKNPRIQRGIELISGEMHDKVWINKRELSQIGYSDQISIVHKQEESETRCLKIRQQCRTPEAADVHSIGS